MSDIDTEYLMKQYENKTSIISDLLVLTVVMLIVFAFAAWSVQTAFGYFGYEFSLLQSAVIILAVQSMVGRWKL